MINKTQYEKLKKEYGDVSSWAIWNTNYNDVCPKNNTNDLSVFKDRNILKILKTDYVFVGLNASSTHGNTNDENMPWSNFHSGYSRQNDYKLRYALQGTQFWGSYITDVIKRHAEVDSKKVIKFLNDHPYVAKENIEDFRRELSILGGKPILIAMGTYSGDILSHYLYNEYEIIKIKHYSAMIGKEKYREEVLSSLAGLM